MAQAEQSSIPAPAGLAVEARGIARRYGEGETAVEALRGVDLEVRSGELVAVMGPSGSGKSTLMHILAGLDKPTAGTVSIAGTEITTLSDAKLTHLRRDHIGFVFQFFNLLPMLDAEENVVLPLSIAGEKPDKAWLAELLERTGLTGRRSHRPSELSGGEQQRVAIARALITKPTILFADEPTGNLDSKTSGEILELMRASTDAYGQTIVMVTHEARAAAIADRILFLEDGLIVKELRGATPAEVLTVMSGLHLIKVALKGLLGRKLRAFLTGLAIVLGVAMISGTYVLTDTIKSAFSTVFTTVYSKTDAVITGKNALGNENNSNNGLPPSFPASLLGKVQNLPGVAAATGGIDDLAYLVGRNGKVISGHGAPSLAFSVHPKGDQRFNPLTLTAGTWPVGPHQVDIDANTAAKNDYKVGETIGVIARGPVANYTIAGIVKIGGVSSLGGATMTIFDFPTAQKVFHKQGRLDGIDIAAKPGTSPQQLVQEIKPLLPATAQVRTSAAQAAQATKDTNGFLSIFNDFLLAFAGVALFVGIFVIANTLSITVTQRTRELATLRTLGAYKRQVRASVLVEAGVIGAIASVSGLFIGLGLAKGLNAVFVHLGIDLPQAGTVFATRTIVVSLVVGIFVTMLAALWPAFRATRVAPVSAVREGAVLEPLLSGPAVTTVALSTIGGAVALMLVGLFVGSLSTTQRLLAVGVGAAAIFLGVALLAKVLVPPLAKGSHPIAQVATTLLTIVIYPELLTFWLLRYAAFERQATPVRRTLALLAGANIPGLAVVAVMMIRQRFSSFEPDWPQGLPSVVPDKSATRLARGNAMRNPSRTAAASAALMIGLALVTLVAVLASGLKATFESAVNSVFKGDYALTATDNFSPIAIAPANALKTVPGVAVVAGVRAGEGRAFGKRIGVTGVSGDIRRVIVVNWQAGSQATPGELGENGAFVSKDYATTNHLAVGSAVNVETPTGQVMHLVLRGIYAPPKGGSPYGDVTISTQRFDREYQNPQNVYAFVDIAGGVTAANTAKLTKALKLFPDAKIATESQFKNNQEQGINTLLNLLYVLLSLSIVISLFGIVNTLVLTVYERTREIGMLRAVGMTRRQVRSMIRHESIVTALIGAALGIPVGIVLALMVGRAIKYPAFTIPVGTLVVFIIAAIVAGLVAAILPARRASRLNVLEALQYE